MTYRRNISQSILTAATVPLISPSFPPHSFSSPKFHAVVHTAGLERLAEEYFYDCDLRLYSPNTIQTRRVFVHNLMWFLRHRGYEICGVSELRHFFYYLAHGHEEPGGRFGNRQLTRPARPITIKDYYIALRALFDWFVAQGILSATPFTAIPKPQVRKEFKSALSVTQITSLLQAAQQSSEPKRDVAILSLLLDTGCRAGELISITLQDLDLKNRCCTVLGKGNKYRTVYFGERTVEALKEYLKGRARFHSDGILPNDAPLFTSAKTHEPLRISGLQQLMKRLKRRCGIRTSCSPHAFRRVFAVQSLKNGANVFSVQAMLGHTDLQMTQTYCALAQADVEQQHRKYSPMDRFDLTLSA